MEQGRYELNICSARQEMHHHLWEQKLLFFFNLCKIVTTHASPLGIFVSPGATTPIGGCILQLSSGL